MTIAGRNRILIFGIGIAALMTAGNISCCITIVAHNLLAEMPAAPESAFRLLRLPFFAYNNYAVMVGIVSLPLTSLLLLVFIFLKKLMRWRFHSLVSLFLPYRLSRFSCFFRCKFATPY